MEIVEKIEENVDVDRTGPWLEAVVDVSLKPLDYHLANRGGEMTLELWVQFSLFQVTHGKTSIGWGKLGPHRCSFELVPVFIVEVKIIVR